MDELTEKIIGAAIEVHKTLGGPGLLESVYEEALCCELKNSGLLVERQISCPIFYKGKKLSNDLKIDILVNKEVVVECKAVSSMNPLFESQCLTYLRLTNLMRGLVLNFGMSTMKEGISRVANNFVENKNSEPAVFYNSAENQNEQNIPTCPICGKIMRKIIAKRGINSGNAFWGCSNYPHCTGARKC